MKVPAIDMEQRSRRNLQDVGSSLVLVTLGILFFWDLLFSSKNFYFRDILNFHYPLRMALIESLCRWELPLWNPYVYLGQPMLANPNYMALYPTNLFHLFLPFNYAFKLHFIVHPILGGLGFYFLMRRLRVEPLGALGGSLAYEFSGAVLAFLNLYNIVPGVAWLPWIGWAYVRALEVQRPARLVLLGFLVALQLTSFEPLILQCVLLLLAGLSVLYVSESGDQWRAFLTVARTGTLSGGIGFGLAAVQIMPSLELLQHSVRGSGIGLADAARWSMHPMDLLNVMVPNLFGNHYTIGHVICWGDSYHEGREGYLVSFFLGSTTVFLSAMGLMHHRRGLGRILLVLAILGVFLALGQHGYLYPWLFEHLSPFRLGRYPSKYFLLTAMAVCMLASLGLEHAFQRPLKGSSKAQIPALLAILAGIVICAASVYSQLHPDLIESWLRMETQRNATTTKDLLAIAAQLNGSVRATGLFLFLIGAVVLLSRWWKDTLIPGALALLLISAELLPANLRLSPLLSEADISFLPEVNSYILEQGPKEPFRIFPPTTTPLRPMPDVRIKTPNLSVAWLTLFYRRSGQPFYGIMSGLQYAIDRSVDYLNTKESDELFKRFGVLPMSSGLALLARINCLLLLQLEEVRDERAQFLRSFDTASDHPLHAYWLQGAQARAYFVEGVEYVASQEEALSRFLRPGFPSGTTVLLEGNRTNSSRPGANGGSVKILDYRSQRVLCAVDVKVPGYLVLLDSYYPGWKCFVDGKESRVLRANYAFRAVEVSPGQHQVEFRYVPWSFYAGLVVASSFLAFCLLWIWKAAGRRNPNEVAELKSVTGDSIAQPESDSSRHLTTGWEGQV